jgi:hypothetical protein
MTDDLRHRQRRTGDRQMADLDVRIALVERDVSAHATAIGKLETDVGSLKESRSEFIGAAKFTRLFQTVLTIAVGIVTLLLATKA